MLLTLLNNEVNVMRLTTVSGTKKALSTVYTSLETSIQNIDTIEAHISEGIASKNYMAWFPVDTDIREGDVLRDTVNSRAYKVLGIEKKGQGMGLQSEHLEVVLTRYNF